MPVGSGREVVVSATPIMFSSPVGLSDLAPSIDDDPVDEPDDELGEVDDFDADDVPA